MNFDLFCKRLINIQRFCQEAQDNLVLINEVKKDLEEEFKLKFEGKTMDLFDRYEMLKREVSDLKMKISDHIMATDPKEQTP